MEWFRKAIQGLRARGGLPDQGYVIDNAEARRDENPRSFSIPRSEQRRSLRVGDSAKIILEATGRNVGPINAERPWVTVTAVEGETYQVKVDNALALFPSLNEATFTIGPEHVISVILPDEYVLPFGKTCLASAAVLGDTAWPHRLVRVPPVDDTDSGWRIFAKGEALADASQPASCDALIGSYQVLDSVMDEPGFEVWEWSDAGNEYRRTIA
jgi:hypothetical protein